MKKKLVVNELHQTFGSFKIMILPLINLRRTTKEMNT